VRSRLRERPLPPEISTFQRAQIHILLLLASLIIHAIFRAMWRTTETAEHVQQTSGSFLGSFVLLVVLAAMAFGAASWFQPRWRSRDAGRVATQVWFVASVGYLLVFGCPRILLLVVLPFIPFCLGALIGHNIGRFHHPAHWDGIEVDLDD
jgi:uncharacterized membrane protein YidH (DUF202 family)